VDGRAIGHVGELHPQWRQAYELPQAPVLFELDLRRRAGHAGAGLRAGAAAAGVVRDLALVVREQSAHDA
jgi:phenylalanyl-tRNA synthetase beta chain